MIQQNIYSPDQGTQKNPGNYRLLLASWTPQGCRGRGRPKNTMEENSWEGAGKHETELERSGEQGTRSGRVPSTACAPARVERQRRRTRRPTGQLKHDSIWCLIGVIDLQMDTSSQQLLRTIKDPSVCWCAHKQDKLGLDLHWKSANSRIYM